MWSKKDSERCDSHRPDGANGRLATPSDCNRIHWQRAAKSRFAVNSMVPLFRVGYWQRKGNNMALYLAKDNSAVHICTISYVDFVA